MACVDESMGVSGGSLGRIGKARSIRRGFPFDGATVDRPVDSHRCKFTPVSSSGPASRDGPTHREHHGCRDPPKKMMGKFRAAHEPVCHTDFRGGPQWHTTC